MFDLRSDAPACRCEAAFDGDRLVVDADDCPEGGRLAAAPDCRATVVGRLRDQDADSVVTEAAGLARHYEGTAAALLVAAGRFVERVAVHDAALAERAERDPLAAGHAAAGRSGPVARVAAETSLADCAAAAESYEGVLRPRVAPSVAGARVTERPPPDARLVDRYDLDTGAVVRWYERPNADLRHYHLTPVELTLDAAATRTLAAAADHLAADGDGGHRAPYRAVRATADPGEVPVDTLSSVLSKHTRGLGALGDLFADPAVSDAYLAAPAASTSVRVEADGETLRTNVRLTERRAAALASRLRRGSGRAFSRAEPTLDATVEAGDRSLRVAAVTDPLSDGYGFAFRAQGADRFRLPDLVDNGTLPPAAAAVIGVAARRGASVLVAGGRGAGKTTLLGALLSELPAASRTVVIEDTPELPVDRLRENGRDVQRLHVDREGDGVAPTAALRTALRLGEGDLVVGEVRGEEASALYEAMRVGTDGATLGTVHGDGPDAVRERVVSDLGVPASSFAATDLVVTCTRAAGGARVVDRVDEVVGTDPEFAPLFDRRGEGLAATGRVDRGNSELVAALAAPDETYADVRDVLAARERVFG
ncbi:ATPase, T2SS/T4P/T4SS family [Halorarius halobius]|uniref:ATPase, T2SS/T4P/T4SS family n=1 Tax=Halorarius halobius TaxID=2962671 RepID=UPI0020CDDE3B|nr:ATPase, T2SS/T4P/T4SS family [Halorarius halobius]